MPVQPTLLTNTSDRVDEISITRHQWHEIPDKGKIQRPASKTSNRGQGCQNICHEILGIFDPDTDAHKTVGDAQGRALLL